LNTMHNTYIIRLKLTLIVSKIDNNGYDFDGFLRETTDVFGEQTFQIQIRPFFGAHLNGILLDIFTT
jgi:hypothetical protein